MRNGTKLYTPRPRADTRIPSCRVESRVSPGVDDAPMFRLSGITRREFLDVLLKTAAPVMNPTARATNTGAHDDDRGMTRDDVLVDPRDERALACDTCIAPSSLAPFGPCGPTIIPGTPIEEWLHCVATSHDNGSRIQESTNAAHDIGECQIVSLMQ